MPFTIAVLADLHLPEIAQSAQAAVLDWAMQAVLDEAPDLVLAAGDMTGTGNHQAAQIIHKELSSLGLPFRIIPGNADVRTPADHAASCAQLTVAEPFMNDTVLVLSLTNPDGDYGACERENIQSALAKAGARQVVLLAHYPPSTADYDWLKPDFEAGRIHLHIAGHRHRDHTEMVGCTEAHIVRGLDPDKAIGGDPALAIFTYDQSWTRRAVLYPGSQPVNWTDDQRQEYLDKLGFSCLGDCFGGLQMALDQNVRCVELRTEPALAEDRVALAKAVRAWRALGDTTLSIHLPNLRWDAASMSIQGQETWIAAIDLAVNLSANALTIHPPRATAHEMTPGGAAWRTLSTFMRDTLTPAAQAQMTLGIENLHMGKNDTPDGSRPFGCLPEEIISWIEELRAELPAARLGLHFDIGHARNNPPFAKSLPISTWYARIGHAISGYHLHQVTPEMKNHQPILDVFGPTISYASFFWAWHTGQIQSAPMYIEVRGGCESIKRSLDCLRTHISGA